MATKTRVIAVDERPDPVGRHAADAHYQVPGGTDPGFVDVLIEICRREQVDAVFCGSDEEAVAVAMQHDRFDELEIETCTPPPDVAPKARNKADVFDLLASRGVRVPEFRRVRGASQLAIAAQDLGYPEVSVIVKPAVSRGNRGIWTLTAEAPDPQRLLESKDANESSLDAFGAALGEHEAELVVMPRFVGAVFDVDILSRGTDDVDVIVPRRRLDPRGTPFGGCYFDDHPGVLELSREVAAAVRFDCLYDIDVMLDDDDRAHLLEVNPRPSGSAIASLKAGISLYERFLRGRWGLELPPIDIPYGLLVRPVMDLVSDEPDQAN